MIGDCIGSGDIIGLRGCIPGVLMLQLKYLLTRGFDTWRLMGPLIWLVAIGALTITVLINSP